MRPPDLFVLCLRRMKCPQLTAVDFPQMPHLSQAKNPLLRRTTWFVIPRSGSALAIALSFLTVFAVCKTCSDYGHTCLGYNDPDKSDKPFTQPTIKDEPAGPADIDDDEPRLSRSPTTPRISTSMAPPDTAKSPKASKPTAVLPLTKDTLIKATKDSDKLGVDSPESSALSLKTTKDCPVADGFLETGRTSLSSINRTHVPYFRYFGPTAIVPGFKQMVRIQ